MFNVQNLFYVQELQYHHTSAWSCNASFDAVTHSVYLEHSLVVDTHNTILTRSKNTNWYPSLNHFTREFHAWALLQQCTFVRFSFISFCWNRRVHLSFPCCCISNSTQSLPPSRLLLDVDSSCAYKLFVCKHHVCNDLLHIGASSQVYTVTRINNT